MFGAMFGTKPGSAATGALEPPGPSRTLLVIESFKAESPTDWTKVFEKDDRRGSFLSDGITRVVVEQHGWDDIMVTSEPFTAGRGDNDTAASLACPRKREKQSTLRVHVRGNSPKSGATKTIAPDFILVRNECYTSTQDFRNELLGFIHDGSIQSVNSLDSIFRFTERPIVHGELVKLNRKHGDGRFPLVEQSYFSGFRGMMYGNRFPCIAKVGSAHAGDGKMKIDNHHAFEDFRSVLKMCNKAYCTAEPLIESSKGAEEWIEGELKKPNSKVEMIPLPGVRGTDGPQIPAPPVYDLRIQKVGKRIRAFKKYNVSGNWKSNAGTCLIKPIPDEDIPEQYRFWAEAASEMFCGLDILTVDAIGVLVRRESRERHDSSSATPSASTVHRSAPGAVEGDLDFHYREFVIEVNGTSSGLHTETEAEDNAEIADLVLQRMSAIFCS